MSTRCQIAFYEKGEKNLENYGALIYRHSDGYPEGVLPDILPFLIWWSKGRGVGDIEYCSARLLQYLCNQYDGLSKKSWEELSGSGEGLTGTLGHGISKTFHDDIDYLYAIYPDKINVYATSFYFKGEKSISERVQLIRKEKLQK